MLSICESRTRRSRFYEKKRRELVMIIYMYNRKNKESFSLPLLCKDAGPSTA